MNYFYKILIAYKGTHYSGWQSLGTDQKTVQDEFKRCLNQICKHQKNNIIASSRTDAGVHALGQTARIEIPIEIDSKKLMRGLNSLLPSDIRVTACAESSKNFHPIADAISKEYHYYFSDDEYLAPHFHELVTKIPNKLNLKKMQKCAKLYVGEHDFQNFYTRDGKEHTTVRTILTCKISTVKADPFFQKVYLLKVKGRGFLKHMIRYMVAALIEAGRERISEKDIKKYLESSQDQKLAPKACAQGLHLFQVKY